ncbi:hypothetical protein JWG42_15695 [Desulfoprunum benzoelyticum]|uniref:Uncharacterized protein n=1 Tax=Desulfoprunum benzoelyticum TaxID=1506996 RepID=A0A840V6S1_9BACT|nr:hypothetical protein [Desulfoprunum benzoelyticum]MBB5349620.1 hypothetical protein [Desulfoprunum benzoelyticum]MBM9531601.1 hypothetical protein [Desulfoprunum benzoelyticum]
MGVKTGFVRVAVMSALWMAILFQPGANWAEAADRWIAGEKSYDVKEILDQLAVTVGQEPLGEDPGKIYPAEAYGNVPWEGADDDELSPVGKEQAGSVAIAMMDDSGRAGVVSSIQEKPPSPPPEQSIPAIDGHTLLAMNASPDDTTPGKGNTAPAPKTTKENSVSTPVLVGAGVAIAVGVAAAAGGSSGSDSDSPTAPTSAPTSGNTDVIHLADLVRIGDDSDYNSNHPDKFKQSRPSGLSWTDTFTINNVNSVRSAMFNYTVAASKVANPIYINGKLAGKLCNPGNTAWNVEACSLNITGYIHSGLNEIMVKCAIDESDSSTPYDDVEIYDLRIELIH